MKRQVAAMCAAGLVLALGSAATATVNIETVAVGNAGNAPDTRYETPGYGAVSYEYNIGKYEVTAGQYTEFLNAVAATDTYGLYSGRMALPVAPDKGCNIQRGGNPGSYTYSLAVDWADRPVNFVSWGDAARFANWLHNGQPTGAQDLTTTEDGAYYLNGATGGGLLLAVSREADWTWAIPTEDEWYKAAYYDPETASYYDHPTSSHTRPGYVNDSGNLSGTGNPFVEGGTDPGGYATWDGDGGTDGIGIPYYRTVVGEWENSDSPYGTFDQGGNVWEWNEAFPYGRGLRGGSFLNSGDFLRASYRGSRDPTDEDMNFGFRVSDVPEPATLSLLALGGLALIRRRRRGLLPVLVVAAIAVAALGLATPCQAGGDWVIRPIASDLVGDAAVAVDSQGNPHVAWSCFTGTGWGGDKEEWQYKYARWDGSSWQTTQFTALATHRSRDTSLVVDGQDRPHMAFYVYDRNTAMSRLVYVTPGSGGAWLTEDVFSGPSGSGADPDLALDSQGRPHISHVGRYSRFDGTQWQTEDAWPIGFRNSLALDAQDTPHVASPDGMYGYPSYGTKHQGQWTQTFIVTPTDAWGMSIDLDAQDKPHVAWWDSSKAVPAYSWDTGSGWDTEWIPDQHHSSFGSKGVSLELDDQGRAHIAYRRFYSSTSKDAAYAVWDLSLIHISEPTRPY